MKVNKVLSVVIALIFVFCCEILAEKIQVEEKDSGSAGFLSKRVGQQEKKVMELKQKHEQTEKNLKSLEEKLGELKEELNSAKNDIKKLDESGMEIKGIMSDLEHTSEKLNIFEEKYKKEKEDIDKFMEDFTEVKGSFKEGTDKMRSWDDVLAVLKKEITNNEMEIARLKKSIAGLQKQYGSEDDFWNQLSNWPYMGIAAMVVSVIALVVAVGK